MVHPRNTHYITSNSSINLEQALVKLVSNILYIRSCDGSYLYTKMKFKANLGIQVNN